jgi:acyl-coenzyme A thioesterase PaaI-like protein
MMTLAEIRAFLDREFPQIAAEGRYTVEALLPRGARLRAAYHENQIRPGGTISGPTMMALADVSLISECRLLKLGNRLAVGEVSIFSEGEEEPVAHVTGTYSIPPR